ncbi:1bc153c3-b1e0-449e-8bc9-2e29dcdb6895 [Thermothielavioides terrestris]|uniref:1bc153c3-b1e0-449e-8bc9-2e29dcdb6895 n=1 Tax=Thermothielavioides terrestris TaxID=2587410 RepID=A0A446BLN6_9PEZI|nr:1bc153c3-b1e0-449e-8bc9-2e29dcdb6895 [Thermothielavioides terrestris]
MTFLYAWHRVVRPTCVDWDEVTFAPYTGEPEATVFDHEHSIYVGQPNPALDAAWKKLLANSNIRVTEAEMEAIPGRRSQAIPLPDGGYYGSLNVYHNLHCIKRLHHYMYPEYYFPNITQRQKEANEFHNHHCLDMLRQSVMCQGDTQILTMMWTPDDRIPTANFSDEGYGEKEKTDGVPVTPVTGKIKRDEGYGDKEKTDGLPVPPLAGRVKRDEGYGDEEKTDGVEVPVREW